MSFDYKLVNNTPTEVTFGLWNAPDKHEEVHTVKGNHQEDHSAKADARIIGVWTDEDVLYPSNSSPFVTGHNFLDGVHYTITLTTSGISVTTP